MRIAVQKQKRLVASVLTVLVITLLVLAGPAQALSLGLTGFAVSTPLKGESVSTTATINVQSNERIDFDEINLVLSGQADRVCSFDVNGFVLSGCDGIEIDLLQDSTSAGYGYGYGYGYNYGYGFQYGYTNGQLTYNITLNTTGFDAGTYNLLIQTSLGGHEYQSSTQSLTVLVDTQQHATNETEVVEDDVTEVVVDSGSSALEEVIVPSTNTGQVNLSLTAVQNSTKQVSLTNEFTLTRESTVNYTAVIPASTVIDGGSAWDGKLTLPQVVSSSAFSVASGTVDVAVEMGSTVELNFSQAVKVVIGGMAGKKAAWARGTGALTSIDTVCDSLTAPTNIDKNTVRECYINDGNDLVIWTYHFTTFSAYTAATTSGGSGGRRTAAVVDYSTAFDSEYANSFYDWSPLVREEPREVEVSPVQTENNNNNVRTARGFTGRVIFDENGNLTGTAWTGLIVLIAVVAGLVTYSRMRKQKKEDKEE